MSQLLANRTAPLQPGITTEQAQTAGGSSISNPHPDFSARRPDWVVMFDTNEGQRHIKSKTTIYLPSTSGMRALSSNPKKLDQEGLELYQAYLTRAYYPDLVKETIRALVGVMDKEPATIELPDALEPMRDRATSKGESLNDLLIQIHMNQMLYGRLGLLADVDEQSDLPILVNYPAPQVLNWDDQTTSNDTRQNQDDKRQQAMRKLLLCVLDETRFERDTGDVFTWNLVSRYRALTLGDGDSDVYTTFVERKGQRQESIVPSIRGRTLERIPLVFINTTDLAAKPGEVPLINLANLALAIYRGEADHRSALFMSGQDTLIVIGEDLGASDDGEGAKPIIGSGAYLNLPTPEADAKFIGPDSMALSEQRTSLENDYTRAGEEGIKLMSSGAGAEAAETLRIRAAARTATLQTMAMTAAAGLEEMLRICAEWVGANPDDVNVEPNLDFIDESQMPADLVQFATAKKAGVPLSWQSVHSWMRKKDFTEKTFEEELEQMSDEEQIEALQPRNPLGMDDGIPEAFAQMMGNQGNVGGQPDDDEDEDDDDDQVGGNGDQ